MQRAIDSNASLLVAHRAAFLHNKWTKRAKALSRSESALHASMPPYQQRVVKGKRLLLLDEMLRDLGYRDVSLARDLINGFDLWETRPKVEPFRPLFSQRK